MVASKAKYLPAECKSSVIVSFAKHVRRRPMCSDEFDDCTSMSFMVMTDGLIRFSTRTYDDPLSQLIFLSYAGANVKAEVETYNHSYCASLL